jgi:hypothetical protein
MLGINMLSNMRLCSNVPAQSVVQTALWGHQSVKDYLVPGGRVYDQRDCVMDELNKDRRHQLSSSRMRRSTCFPKLDVDKFNITDDMQFRPRPPEGEEGPHRAGDGLQLGQAGPLPHRVPAARERAERGHPQDRRLPDVYSDSIPELLTVSLSISSSKVSKACSIASSSFKTS